jgi:hypothetical protein
VILRYVRKECYDILHLHHSLCAFRPTFERLLLAPLRALGGWHCVCLGSVGVDGK